MLMALQLPSGVFDFLNTKPLTVSERILNKIETILFDRFC